VRELSHLPVIADPSHGTGKRELIAPASRAALAIGADGLIIEVHPCPERALSDGAQSLTLDEFARLMEGLSAPIRPVAMASCTSRSKPGSGPGVEVATANSHICSNAQSLKGAGEVMDL
jgi:hypothetical protein